MRRGVKREDERKMRERSRNTERRRREGCDCYVTGNADEPSPSLAREEAIHFLAFGHYATERVGIRRLGEVVAERFGLEVRFIEVGNPL